MDKKEFIAEHKRLLKVLKSGSKAARLKEYKLQKNELVKVLKRNGIYRS